MQVDPQSTTPYVRETPGSPGKFLAIYIGALVTIGVVGLLIYLGVNSQGHQLLQFTTQNRLEIGRALTAFSGGSLVSILVIGGAYEAKGAFSSEDQKVLGRSQGGF